MSAINRDPEVTRYLNRPADPEGFYSVFVEHWQRHGFGFFAVECRGGSASRFVGFVGVAYFSFLPELGSRPELGWRLARAAWGRGLATEAACAARDDAFERLALRELISIIHPENERSRRVATKLGMRVAQQVHIPSLDRDVDVWQLSREKSAGRVLEPAHAHPAR